MSFLIYLFICFFFFVIGYKIMTCCVFTRHTTLQKVKIMASIKSPLTNFDETGVHNAAVAVKRWHLGILQ